jgi:AraC family transcriptional regulator
MEVRMQVEIRQFPELRVAAVRHVGAYDTISQSFAKLCDVAGPAGLFQQPDAAMVALYHNDPASTPTNQLASDAGIIVPANTTLPKGLTEQRLPAGAYACTTFVGPYEKLGAEWERFKSDGLRESGRRMRGGAPSYELYLNDPSTTPKEQLRTELRIPVS